MPMRHLLKCRLLRQQSTGSQDLGIHIMHVPFPNLILNVADGDEFPMNLAAMQGFLMCFCLVWKTNFGERNFRKVVE